MKNAALAAKQLQGEAIQTRIFSVRLLNAKYMHSDPTVKHAGKNGSIHWSAAIRNVFRSITKKNRLMRMNDILLSDKAEILWIYPQYVMMTRRIESILFFI